MSLIVEVHKDFGEFVLNASFEAENEIVALLGASGCGKSMTLRCIAGVVRPDEGRIVVDGRTLFDSAKGINLPPQRRRVGLLFQNYALFPNMTVRENISAVLRLSDRANVQARFAAICEKFYIAGLENHYPAQLSGGQQQRVALARIMASEPAIIMLDEPLSALDSYLRWQIEDELAQILAEYRGTTLYVSHNRDEVYRLCNKVCVMTRGRTEEMRTVKQLFEAPNTLASSLLSGCKNYSRIERRGANVVYATDWRTEFSCAEAIGEDIRYIGVRAHYIRPCEGDGENVFVCRVTRVLEDVFSTVVNMAPAASTDKHDFAKIRMEMSKEAAAGIRAGDLLTVGIRPEDIMLLRK